MKLFEMNKIAAGLLLAVIAFVVSNQVATHVFTPDKLEKQAYIVETPQEAETAAAPGGGADSASKAKAPEPVSFASLMEKADAKKGATVAKKCGACHDMTAAAKAKVGPALWGVFERDIASGAFKYSDALSAKKPAKWDVDHLDHWLKDPKGYAPGNKMSFAGVKKDEDRAHLIAFLKTLK